MANPAAAKTAVTWSGGSAPLAMGSKKLGMWLFLVSDTLTFGALLVAYSYVRVANRGWPTPFEVWPAIAFATLMTAVLLSSSLTMVFAVSASQRHDRARTVRHLVLTMIGGVAFIVLHTREWLHLIHDGVTPFSNPWGPPLFGATFFGLTGLHMTHVAIGVIYLAIIAIGFGRGKFTPEDVEVCGLYWHFVDLVWMFIFPLVYLMSVKM